MLSNWSVLCRRVLVQVHCWQCLHSRPAHQYYSTLHVIHRGFLFRQLMASQSSLNRVQSWNVSTTAAYLKQFQGDKEFDITQNPYFAKYGERLKELAKELPEVYNDKLQELESKLKDAKEQRRQELTEPLKPLTGVPGSWPPKSLDEIMKVELCEDKTAEEIEQLWKQHHLLRDCVFTVVKEIEYDAMMKAARTNPTFIYPLPRQDGYEFILSQFSTQSLHFTPLQMFQLVKENAQSCLTVVHFTEFKHTKGIVLMAGKYDDKFLNKLEAVNLVRQMALYYGPDSEERHHLLESFNNAPQDFKHMDVVEEYKKIKQKVEIFS